MPIYEYRCAECGHELDALQKLADEPLKECPECSQPTLRRLISAPAFRLKGAGWYETDFKSDKERKRNLAGEGKSGGDGAAKAGATDGATKSDGAKSDAKTDGAKTDGAKKDAKKDKSSPDAKAVA